MNLASHTHYPLIKAKGKMLINQFELIIEEFNELIQLD
jgi:hypothetical protein